MNSDNEELAQQDEIVSRFLEGLQVPDFPSFLEQIFGDTRVSELLDEIEIEVPSDFARQVLDKVIQVTT